MSNRKLLVLTVFFVLTACANMAGPPIQLQIKAAPRLNQDQALSSLPVRAKVYQLSDINAFKNASFPELWKADKKTLDKALLAKNEFTITPNSQEKTKIERVPGAKYIAVMGIFRTHPDDNWKTWKKLPNQVGTILKPVVINLQGFHVEIS